jgi:hypothetical protein
VIGIIMVVRKITGVIVLVGIFVTLIAVINTIHFQFFPVNVVLYDTLKDVLIAGALTGVIYYAALRGRLDLTGTEATLSLFIGLLIGAFYAISVPTVIDRSLSIYILEKLEQRGGGIRRDAFAGVFKDEYLPEHKLVDIRLTEQLNSRTIRIENGCVVLTDLGRRIAHFTRYYRTHILPRQREVMGVYTDAITDPFRHSTSDVSYRCKP